MAINSERVRLADGVNRSREAAALLTGAVASVSQLRDPELHRLVRASLEAVGRLEARLRLLEEAYLIAERQLAHGAAVGVPVPVPALTSEGGAEELAQPSGYFLEGS